MNTKVSYKTYGDIFDLNIESVINKDIKVDYFRSKEYNDKEIISISCIGDSETKERLSIVIYGSALEEFIERMSAICALRFKNSPDMTN